MARPHFYRLVNLYNRALEKACDDFPDYVEDPKKSMVGYLESTIHQILWGKEITVMWVDETKSWRHVHVEEKLTGRFDDVEKILATGETTIFQALEYYLDDDLHNSPDLVRIIENADYDCLRCIFLNLLHNHCRGYRFDRYNFPATKFKWLDNTRLNDFKKLERSHQIGSNPWFQFVNLFTSYFTGIPQDDVTECLRFLTKSLADGSLECEIEYPVLFDGEHVRVGEDGKREEQ